MRMSCVARMKEARVKLPELLLRLGKEARVELPVLLGWEGRNAEA